LLGIVREERDGGLGRNRTTDTRIFNADRKLKTSSASTRCNVGTVRCACSCCPAHAASKRVTIRTMPMHGAVTCLYAHDSPQITCNLTRLTESRRCLRRCSSVRRLWLGSLSSLLLDALSCCLRYMSSACAFSSGHSPQLYRLALGRGRCRLLLCGDLLLLLLLQCLPYAVVDQFPECQLFFGAGEFDDSHARPLSVFNQGESSVVLNDTTPAAG
jgi:hypothetical protein